MNIINSNKMVNIINQFSNYSFSSNHNQYEGIIDLKTPVNNVIIYYESGIINDNLENQKTKDNLNNLNEKVKNEDSTIKMNEITKDETIIYNSIFLNFIIRLCIYQFSLYLV